MFFFFEEMTSRDDNIIVAKLVADCIAWTRTLPGECHGQRGRGKIAEYGYSIKLQRWRGTQIEAKLVYSLRQRRGASDTS